MNKTLLLVMLTLLWIAVPTQAQTVGFDVPNGTIAGVGAWTPILYVNNTPFTTTAPLVCTQAGTLTSCTYPMPVIASALTATGPQTFELALKDVVLGEGPRSLPLSKTKPGAAINLQLK